MPRTLYQKFRDLWKDKPDKTTPVTAEALMHIEQGIYDNSANMALKEIYGDNSISLGRKAYSGYKNTANSIAVGEDVETLNKCAAFGSGTSATNISLAEGYKTTASGFGSHAEGCNTQATGDYAHSEGWYTKAIGKGSHAEGYYTTASAEDSHAEGGFSKAIRNYSHAEGYSTESGGYDSHAEGYSTKASGEFQHVQGKFNIDDPNSTYAHIVGGGTSENDRKNIHTLDWNGNAWFAGNVTNGNGVSLSGLKSEVDEVRNIARGASTAKVFNTKEELDEWLAVEGNTETLKVGQNIYIKAKDTPDYWWDGTGLQELETGTVTIEELTYEETIAILNGSGVA